MAGEEHMTPFEKKQIWKVIYEHMKPDDRDPAEVILQNFAGNEEQYLITMAKYHGVEWVNGLNADRTRL